MEEIKNEIQNTRIGLVVDAILLAMCGYVFAYRSALIGGIFAAVILAAAFFDARKLRRLKARMAEGPL